MEYEFTHEGVTFKSGDKVSCKIEMVNIDEAELYHDTHNHYWLLRNNNRSGVNRHTGSYKYSWAFSAGSVILLNLKLLNKMEALYDIW